MIGSEIQTSAISRLSSFSELTGAEIEALKGLAGPPQKVQRGATLWQEGDNSSSCGLLLDGWMASSVSFDDGERQIVAVHLPGDMLGTSDLALRQPSDTIFAITPATVMRISVDELGRLFDTHPRIAALLFLISQEERVLMMDRLASMGRTSALQAMSAVMLQLHARASRNNPDAKHSFEMPLSQAQLADLLGISPVHANRTIQHLRREKIIRWSKGTLTVCDRDRLVTLANLPTRTFVRDPSWLPKAR